MIARTEEFIRKYKAGQRSREARGRQTRSTAWSGSSGRRSTRTRDPHPADAAQRPQVLPRDRCTVGYRAPTARRRAGRDARAAIERGDRVGLIGPNGGGKSTLLKTLVGEIPALKGRFEPRHERENRLLRPGARATAGWRHAALGRAQRPADGRGIGAHLPGRFLFSEDDVFKPVAALSGGERSRLALAVLLLQNANFLILDEPTNHLDIAARETLEELLRLFDGTVLFVSHDRYFIDRVATQIWAVDRRRS